MLEIIKDVYPKVKDFTHDTVQLALRSITEAEGTEKYPGFREGIPGGFFQVPPVLVKFHLWAATNKLLTNAKKCTGN
jgi:hypothetical protein